MKNNPVGWFEIPVTDMERAISFYEKVLDMKLQKQRMDEFDMAWFPMDHMKPGAAGALVYHEESYKPSTDGVLVFFSAPSGNLESELGKVQEAGGKILREKNPIGEHGFTALVQDTEGNRIALHSMK